MVLYPQTVSKSYGYIKVVYLNKQYTNLEQLHFKLHAFGEQDIIKLISVLKG